MFVFKIKTEIFLFYINKNSSLPSFNFNDVHRENFPRIRISRKSKNFSYWIIYREIFAVWCVEVFWWLFLFFFQTVSVTVSVMTLTSISIDRWYAICHPLKFKSTTSRARTAIIIIWIVGLASGNKLLLNQMANAPRQAVDSFVWLDRITIDYIDTNDNCIYNQRYRVVRQHNVVVLFVRLYLI